MLIATSSSKLLVNLILASCHHVLAPIDRVKGVPSQRRCHFLIHGLCLVQLDSLSDDLLSQLGVLFPFLFDLDLNLSDIVDNLGLLPPALPVLVLVLLREVFSVL